MMKRLSISILCLACAGAAPALAQTSDADRARAPFQACGSIADKDQRVACYDRALGETDAERERRASAERAEQDKRRKESFGLARSPAPKQQRQQRASQPRPTRPADADRIDLQVARATMDGIGRWTIQSTNGAVWRQTETVREFRPPAAGQSVSVHKGAMGSYLLRVGNQPYTRVTRVR